MRRWHAVVAALVALATSYSSAANACSPNRNEVAPAAYRDGNLFDAYARHSAVIQLVRVERRGEPFAARGGAAYQFDLVVVETLVAPGGAPPTTPISVGALRAELEGPASTYLDVAGTDPYFLSHNFTSEVLPNSFCYFDFPAAFAIGEFFLAFRTQEGALYRVEDVVLALPIGVRTEDRNKQFRLARSLVFIRGLDDPNLLRMRQAIESVCSQRVRRC